MSNILKTIEYLKQSPQSRFLTLVNLENNSKIGKASIYLDDIPNEDLQHYIKTSMGPISKPTLVWVELRVKNGSSSMKKDAYKVQIDPPVQEFNNVPALIPQNAPQTVPQVHEAQPNFFQTGGLGATLGLGFPQIMEMQRKSDRLSDKEEQLAELKEEFKELKQKNNILEIDNRELKTKLSTSEAKQEMAVMMVKAENKSFYDSPAFEK